MKMFLICDNMDTKTGMRLAGIEGVIAHTREEVLEAMKNALKDKDIGIMLITERLVDLVDAEITQIRVNNQTPLIVEIPGRNGSKRSDDTITRHVREAIGLKI